MDPCPPIRILKVKAWIIWRKSTSWAEAVFLGCCWRGGVSVETTYSSTVNSIKVTTSAQREAPDPINVNFVKMLSSSAVHCGDRVKDLRIWLTVVDESLFWSSGISLRQRCIIYNMHEGWGCVALAAHINGNSCLENTEKLLSGRVKAVHSQIIYTGYSLACFY